MGRQRAAAGADRSADPAGGEKHRGSDPAAAWNHRPVSAARSVLDASLIMCPQVHQRACAAYIRQISQSPHSSLDTVSMAAMLRSFRELGSPNDIFQRVGKFDSTYTTRISESFRITAPSGTTGTRSPRRKIGKIDENDCQNGALRPADRRTSVLELCRRSRPVDARWVFVFRGRVRFADSRRSGRPQRHTG
jgi:hypothetical protein